MKLQQFSKIPHGLIYAIVVFVCLSLVLRQTGLADAGDRMLFDTLMRLRIQSRAIEMNPLISPVDLNDGSLKSLKEKIDTREAFADLVDVLSDFNASQTVLDFLFQFPKNEEADGLFIDAVREADNAILALLVLEKDGDDYTYPQLTAEEEAVLKKNLWYITVKGQAAVPEAGAVILPFPELAEASKALGHINAVPDQDGIFRHVPLLYRWEDGYIPALPLVSAAMYWGIEPDTIILYPGRELVLPLPLFGEGADPEYIRIPVDDQCRMIIPFVKTWAESYDRIYMERLVMAKDDKEAASLFRDGMTGQIALTAEVTTTQKDIGPTAFEGIYPLSGIHAAVLSSLLDGTADSFIGRPTLAFKALSLLGLFAALLFACRAKKDIFFHAVFFSIALIFTAFNFIRWQYFHIIPWYTLGICAALFSWLTAFSVRLLTKYHEQSLLENALSRYFHHDLVSRIIKEGKVELVPSSKELSILFSDIAGFTRWSSDKDPKLVHEFLSNFHGCMANIIFAHQGTVDKFIGDGMLAFFGDPLELPNHAEQCVAAAMAMQRKVRELAVEWNPLVNIDLHIRIGINTGKVIVGNLGDASRIEYTVIGAAVNLAQRMESNANIGGILVTGKTRKMTGRLFPFGERRTILVKGYDEQEIEVYDIEGKIFDT
ncbi:MAG: adenylate/guanylate cyclase domain-containing protein [Treponema sp.]|jgi:adenylate cyclase|nr:adenylate/guanylate cyclase domain-containing protein [Treponema sp.]